MQNRGSRTEEIGWAAGSMGSRTFRPPGIIWAFVFAMSILARPAACSEEYPTTPSDPAPRIHFLDVGEGSATWIEIGDGRHVLVDTGNILTGAKIPATLKQAGAARLDALIVTHPHPDHMGGVFHVLPALEVMQVYDNGQEIPPAAECDAYRWYGKALRTRPDYRVLKQGDTLKLGPVTLEVLWPPKPDAENWNENALVLRVDLSGTKILLMSDAGVPVERKLLSQKIDLAAEGLQVGHHGADDATSPSFLNAVAPRWAVISAAPAGFRNYPAQSTIERIEKSGTKVVLTWIHGDCCWSKTRGLECIR